MIRLSRIHFPVTTLGPGLRVGIWFQGCSIRCQGCISMDTWAEHGSLICISEIVELLRGYDADGVTISGGEPFDQTEGLLELLQALRVHFPAWDVLVFSGYPAEHLPHLSLDLIDALISDPFQLDLPQTLALRGSDNQRLHLLTSRGEARFGSYDRPRTPLDDAMDLTIDAGTVWMAGIPRRGDLQRLQGLLEAQGTLITTTEGKS